MSGCCWNPSDCGAAECVLTRTLCSLPALHHPQFKEHTKNITFNGPLKQPLLASLLPDPPTHTSQCAVPIFSPTPDALSHMLGSRSQSHKLFGLVIAVACAATTLPGEERMVLLLLFSSST